MSCEYCNNPLYVGTKCKNCGGEPAPVQEPVAWMHTSGHIQMFHPHWEQVVLDGYTREKGWTPLYTTPPATQRQWVGLTDEEFDDLRDNNFGVSPLISAVEAKLKEKNT